MKVLILNKLLIIIINIIIKMNFSYPLKFSGKSGYSPNGRYLSITKGYEVIVKQLIH